MTVQAISGSPSDVLAAIDLAKATEEDEVLVPPGTWMWNEGVDAFILRFVPPPQGLTIRGAGIGLTVFEMTIPPTKSVVMISAEDYLGRGWYDGTPGVSARVTGITFKGKVVAEDFGIVGVRMKSLTDFRVDHNEFIDMSGTAIISENYYGRSHHRGLFDHNTISNPYKDRPDYTGSKNWGYGMVAVGGASGSGYLRPDIDYYLGKYEGLDDITVFEDNKTFGCRHSTASNQNAWYLARKNEFHDLIPVNYTHVDVHGQAGPTSVGGRGLECYENLFVGYPSNGNYYTDAIGLRGGGGVVYNNVYQNLRDGVLLMWYEPGPAAAIPNDIWIWGNTPEKVTVSPGWENLIIEGENFFVGTPRPGYTPYRYPHRLVSDEPPPPMRARALIQVALSAATGIALILLSL